MITKTEVIKGLNFGQRVAEEEAGDLARYFVETDLWRRLFSGEVDVVYGPKGSGKSALYALLLARQDALRDRKILLAPAENPRGATAFRDLIVDPPTTEAEFIALWKLYFACLLLDLVESGDTATEAGKQLRSALEAEGLVRSGRKLGTMLRDVLEYLRRAKPASFEAGVEIDPLSGLPKGFKGKITLQEPSQDARGKGYRSVDDLLDLANQALEKVDSTTWILLDRLDVAFAESPELEQNGLRALFHVYLDLLGLRRIRLKIFLRSDIWRRLTEGGFREASHVTRHMTIAWDERSLLNLIVRRVVENDSLLDFFELSKEEALASRESQEGLFYRVFPSQIDIGPNKPRAFEWMVGRTRDGTGRTAPRELVHLLDSLREVQIRRLEVGDPPPPDEELFDRVAFKEALVEVSRTRLEQTLLAEYPAIRSHLDLMRGEKTLQTVPTLVNIWHCPNSDAASRAFRLVELGFFEQRGTKDAPEFWVPFIYRDALDLVQGAAEQPTESKRP